MDVGIVILAASALCVGAILVGALSQKIDTPILLVFLLAGMLAGREGPGGISIDATQTILVWGSAALAAILFEGGLRTKPSVFKLGLSPGLVLSFAGTLVTAFLVAPIAHWGFKLDWTSSLLLGAIVSSTDAAAVFALASTSLKLPDRVTAVLEVESGFNDPLAILMVIGLSISLAVAPMSAVDWFWILSAKIGLGAFVGIAIGWLSPQFLKRVILPSGLMSILIASLGFLAFGLSETIGGSGFLSIYLTGFILTLRAPEHAGNAGGVIDGIAWLAQTGLFLMLGLLITPSHLASVALPALALSLVLIFFARPIAVLLSLWPFRFRVRDISFVAWTGLRGATPIFLGLLPAALGVPNGNLYLSSAAVVVLLSLIIQGWTAPMVGKALNLIEGDDTVIDRKETLARFGAVASSIIVGAWFVIALSPASKEQTVNPKTTVELQKELALGTSIPVSFPPGFTGQTDEERHILFVETLAKVVETANKEVMNDRSYLEQLAEQRSPQGRLTLEQEADIDAIARRYDLDFAQPETLLEHIDIVPVRMAIAQAVLATGWASSSRTIDNHAVFGLNLDTGYSDLLEATRGLISLYASHPDFDAFRTIRNEKRLNGKQPTSDDLVSLISPYAAEGASYADQVRSVMTNGLVASAND